MAEVPGIKKDQALRKLIGLFFIVLGGWFMGQSAGLMPINEEALCAPHHVLFLIGSIIAVMGIMLLVGYDAAGYDLWAALLLVLMGSLFLWFSLYIDPDGSSCGKQMNGYESNGLGVFGRILAGGMGLVAYASVIVALKRFIRSRQTRT